MTAYVKEPLFRGAVRQWLALIYVPAIKGLWKLQNRRVLATGGRVERK
jgi:hypothetical protein